jgi:hypothetical protein
MAGPALPGTIPTSYLDTEHQGTPHRDYRQADLLCLCATQQQGAPADRAVKGRQGTSIVGPGRRPDQQCKCVQLFTWPSSGTGLWAHRRPRLWRPPSLVLKSWGVTRSGVNTASTGTDSSSGTGFRTLPSLETPASSVLMNPILTRPGQVRRGLPRDASRGPSVVRPVGSRQNAWRHRKDGITRPECRRPGIGARRSAASCGCGSLQSGWRLLLLQSWS